MSRYMVYGSIWNEEQKRGALIDLHTDYKWDAVRRVAALIRMYVTLGYKVVRRHRESDRREWILESQDTVRPVALVVMRDFTPGAK